MSSVSLPVTRPAGRALLIGGASARAQAADVLARLGFEHADRDDPYAAMADLAAAPTDFAAVVMGLQGLYREELQVIAVIKQRFPHIEVWLTELEGRQSAFAEALRLGADGLLGEDGLHRIQLPKPTAAAAAVPPAPVQQSPLPAIEPAKIEQAESRAKPQRNSRSRKAVPASAATAPPGPRSAPSPASSDIDEPMTGAEPILTADELRALLQESPSPAEEER